MDPTDILSQEIMKRLKRPNNTFIPMIVRRLVPTEEEARVLLELAMPPEEIAKTLGISREEVDRDLRSPDKSRQIEAIARKLNIPEKKIAEIIQEKFELGLIFPTRRGWQVGIVWTQFRESTLRIEPKYDEKMGKEFFDLHRAWNELEEYPRMRKSWTKLEIKGMRCLPDWQAIKDNPDRIADEYLPDILERASKLEGMGTITFVNCPCQRMVKGLDYNESEVKVCFQMGRYAGYPVRRSNGKKFAARRLWSS